MVRFNVLGVSLANTPSRLQVVVTSLMTSRIVIYLFLIPNPKISLRKNIRGLINQWYWEVTYFSMSWSNSTWNWATLPMSRLVWGGAVSDWWSKMKITWRLSCKYSLILRLTKEQFNYKNFNKSLTITKTLKYGKS